MDIGIDIGTGSVRSYAQNFSRTCDIATVHHNHKVITQSSKNIYDAILSVLPEKLDQVNRICFTATCLMVVREKVAVDGREYLIPFNCGLSDDIQQDIILWMDNRAEEQCKVLNEQLSGTFMKKTVGKFVPELGLPKLKWLSDNVLKQLYCFELYDWFSYVFQVGYQEERVPFELRDFDFKQGNAIDGSIKGWTAESLLFIGLNIRIGKSESLSQTPSKLLHIGEYIGEVSSTLLPHCSIYNGCIDCYAGWVSTITDIPNSVLMIAGTLTCFIFETTTPNPEPVDGIWGPFELIEGRYVYSFGQPATGKLFEDLFAEFEVHDEPFTYAESLTRNLEQKYAKSITQLIKNYHFYGDKYGNRSPLMDFSMNQCLIDGRNGSELGSMMDKSNEALAIRYNLILEFLCFQTAQLLRDLPVENLVVSGSQVQNQRFLDLLCTVTNKSIYILEGNHSLNVAAGSARLCRGISTTKSYKLVANKVSDDSSVLLHILQTKRNFIYEFIELQTRLHLALNK